MADNSEKKAKREKFSREIEEFKRPPRTPEFFLYFRYSGIAMVILASIFLAAKNRPPILSFLPRPLPNYLVGNGFLTIGAAMFLIYILYRVFAYIKKYHR